MQLKQPQITEFCKAVASGCSPYNAFVAVLGYEMFGDEKAVQDIANKLAAEKEIEIATIRKRNMLANIDVTTLNSGEMDLSEIKAMLSNFARESESYEVVEGKAIITNSRKDRLQSLKMLVDIHFKESEINNNGKNTEDSTKYDFLEEEGSNDS